MWEIGNIENCPKCGYLAGGDYKIDPALGWYEKGYSCGGCGYIDKEAEAQLLTEEIERDIRVKKLKENPPRFKSVEDWEKWKAENDK